MQKLEFYKIKIWNYFYFINILLPVFIANYVIIIKKNLNKNKNLHL